MPAGAIQDQDDLLGRTRSRLAGKGGQFGLKERDAHAGRQMKERASRGRMDEADQIAPGVAVLDRGYWTLPNRRPDARKQRLQADAMLVGRPQLHSGLRKGGRDLTQQRPYLFLKASCATGSACTCCGRGICWLCLSRCR